jgi:hypothetical protein
VQVKGSVTFGTAIVVESSKQCLIGIYVGRQHLNVHKVFSDLGGVSLLTERGAEFIFWHSQEKSRLSPGGRHIPEPSVLFLVDSLEKP